MESNMPLASSAPQRALTRVYTTPPAAPGFIGEGHTAVEVLAPNALAASDPFVLLMDDRLDVRRAAADRRRPSPTPAWRP
jgi:hypothetical protein